MQQASGSDVSGLYPVLNPRRWPKFARVMTEIDTHNDEPGTRYEVVFFSGEYFAVGRQSDGVSGLINEVVVRLDLSDVSERCHVPMMIAPHNHSVWWSQ